MKYFFICLAMSLIACGQFPKDPEGSLNNARNRVLKVGITVSDTANAVGLLHHKVNVDLVNGFAHQINARVQWVYGNESDIVKLLEEHELHMAVGSYTSNTPLLQHAGNSKPYDTINLRIAALPGDPLPQSIKDKEVLATSRLAAAYIKKKGGKPVLVDSLRQGYPVAVTDDQLAQLKAQPGDIILHEAKYIVLIPKGENAFLFELEKYIASHGSR